MASPSHLLLGAMALLPGLAMADWKLDAVQDFAAARTLDPAFWAVETGFHRNREDQYYTPANLSLGEGFLRIEARRETVPNAAHRGGSRDWRVARREARYTSGSIVSRRSFRYGRIEVVARSPSGAGVWPAIWLLHESAGVYGEIDVFEAVGKHPGTAFAGVHFGRDARTRRHRSASREVPGLEGTWRVHTVEWTPSRIVVRLDGEPLLEFDPGEAMHAGGDPLRQPMHLRINLALGGSWGGTIDDSRLPARFDIASVRVWRWEPGAGEDVAPAVLPADSTRRDAAPRWGR